MSRFTSTTTLARSATQNWKTCDYCEKCSVLACGFPRPPALGRGGFAQGVGVVRLSLLVSWMWLYFRWGHTIVRLGRWRSSPVPLLSVSGNQSWRCCNYGSVLCVFDL